MDLIEKLMIYANVCAHPSAAMKRRSRPAIELENGKRLFAESEVRALLDVAHV